MKKKLAAVCLASMAWSSWAQVDLPMPDSAPSAGPEYTPLQLLETWGWVLAEQFNLKALEMTSDEVDAIARGMTKYVEGVDPATDLQYSMQQMQFYFASREKQVLARQIEMGKAVEQQFFDSLFGKPHIQSLGTGLHFEILTPGTGAKPKSSDRVLVNYKGTLINGTEFDSSYARGKPSEFVLNSVIPGWTQGLPLIAEGGKLKLYVPAKLGYGDQIQADIPAASTLIFEIELIKILPPGAEGQ